MSLKFTSGQLIKMGKFKDAITPFYDELAVAMDAKVTNPVECFNISKRFSRIMLNPSDFDEVQAVGDAMLRLIMRIPGYLEPVSKEDFYKNVKMNYETIEATD
jgi:hypothetical protein